jgi:hypothetical protein
LARILSNRAALQFNPAVTSLEVAGEEAVFITLLLLVPGLCALADKLEDVEGVGARPLIVVALRAITKPKTQPVWIKREIFRL